MVSLTPDPTNPDRLVLTMTVSLYLDRLASDVLSSEVAAAVREKAKSDLKSNKEVRKGIADAAHRLLLGMLGSSVGTTDTGAEAPKEEANGKQG